MTVKEFLAVVAVVLLGAMIFSLVRGILDGEPAAFMVVGAIITLALTGIGGGVVLGILSISNHWGDRRAEREQSRFQANAGENLDIMRQVSLAQTAQARALAAHQATLQRSLSASSGDTVDADFVAFNPALLDSLELEE
jgi:hypothetical protein